MVRFLGLLFGLISCAAFAGNGSGNVSSVIELGGKAAKHSFSNFNIPVSEFVKDPATAGNYFFAEIGINPTDGNCTILKKNGANATGGTNGTVCFLAFYTSGGSNQNAQLVYTDNSYVDNSSCTSQTNPVYMGGSSSRYPLRSGGGSGADPTSVIPILFKVPSGKYLAAQFNNAGGYLHEMRLLCKDL